MHVVAVDANALMLPADQDLRLFAELERLLGDYEAVVPQSVRDELAELASGTGEAATAAGVAADLAVDRCDSVETEESYADDALHALAVGEDVDAVVTNDGPLKERVLDAGTPVIHLRGRNQLTITRP
jgi:rRNA-processing protein FCF1